MSGNLRQFRRDATQRAIRLAISAAAGIPVSVQRPVARALVAFSGTIPILRSRVRENMRLALGDEIPVGAAGQYFRQVGWNLSNSLSAFQYGLATTPVPNEVILDASVRLLDDAVMEGRGVVLTAPHWSGHELVAAVINRRHPTAYLVRQAPTPERMARKLKWYDALGVEIVLRPSQPSAIKDAVAYLGVLKRGKVLALTPDLLADPGQGVEVCIFGRPARLPGGVFALAIAAKAPVIRLFLRWQSDLSVVVMFDRVPMVLDTGDRDAAIRAGLQDWCCWFEEKVRANPENWLFWLDKRWSRFLRTTPRGSSA